MIREASYRLGQFTTLGEKFQTFRVPKADAIETTEDLVVELVGIETEQPHTGAEGFITKSIVQSLQAHFDLTLATKTQTDHGTGAIQLQKATRDLGPAFPIDIEVQIRLDDKRDPSVREMDAQGKALILPLKRGFPLLVARRTKRPAIGG